MEADFNASVGQLFECFSSGAAARAQALSQNSFDHLQSARRSLRQEEAGYERMLADYERRLTEEANLHQQQQQEAATAAESKIREAKEEALRYKEQLGARDRELVDVKKQLVASQTASQTQHRIDLAVIDEINGAHDELERKVRILDSRILKQRKKRTRRR